MAFAIGLSARRIELEKKLDNADFRLTCECLCTIIFFFISPLLCLIASVVSCVELINIMSLHYRIHNLPEEHPIITILPSSFPVLPPLGTQPFPVPPLYRDCCDA